MCNITVYRLYVNSFKSFSIDSIIVSYQNNTTVVDSFCIDIFSHFSFIQSSNVLSITTQLITFIIILPIQ
ncbi:hypothetical protein RVBP17_1750 [Pseudomonas phage sp. 30-3]|nr:hypothetical protein RVBP16_2220 [Pseudomonas phage sp. 30-2]BDR26132.1 hypothetical protein RVBP17_1750 [Pseudomonas phage sp. 30-3]